MKKSKKIRGTFTRTRRVLTALFAVGLLSSCQATRTITTQAEHRQIGDTAMIIQTKTIESYIGKKVSNL